MVTAMVTAMVTVMVTAMVTVAPETQSGRSKRLPIVSDVGPRDADDSDAPVWSESSASGPGLAGHDVLGRQHAPP